MPKSFPFDPLGKFRLPISGVSNPQSGFLRTPIIQTTPVSKGREVKDVLEHEEPPIKKPTRNE